MKKLTAVMLLLVLLCGCAPAKQEKAWYTFTDSTGEVVSLPEKPKTVAVLFSSYAEIWVLAGGTVDITVGESVERGFAKENAVLVDAGAGKTIDHEALLAAEPDLVIGSADIAAQVEACQMASRAGIPAALFRVDTFEEYLSMLRICADITENDEAYARNGAEVKNRVDAILAEAPKAQSGKRILFIRAGSRYSATKAKRAPENFVCIMLDQLGAYNIADEAALLLDGLSLEAVMQQDPDYIFLTAMGDQAAAEAYIGELFSQEGWRELTAVETGNYSFLPKELFHFKPNARWAEAYGYLAELLYEK